MKKKFTLMIVLGILMLIPPLGGQTWTASKRLTYNSGSSFYADIAADSNNHLHVVWNDNSSGNYEIYYKRSTDGGVTWTTKRLTYSPGHSYSPSIAVDSNDFLHIIWYDEFQSDREIFYKKSTDGGATWATKRLTYNPGYSWNQDLAVDPSDNLHIVWQDISPYNDEIFYKKSTDGGATWITKRLTYNSGGSEEPVIAADSSGRLHVTWHDVTSGNWELYYKKSTDGGATWTTKRLTYNSGPSNEPDIAIGSDNHLHVAWVDRTPGNREIYYKKSTDGGATWSTQRLTDNSGSSYSPAITLDSNNYIQVAWYDYIGGDYQIFHKRSTDGGATWATKRLTYSSGGSVHPAIAADSGNNIHVVWHGNASGNNEIYYKKGIQ